MKLFVHFDVIKGPSDVFRPDKMPMLVPEDSINDVLEISNPAVNLRAIVDKNGGLVSSLSGHLSLFLTKLHVFAPVDIIVPADKWAVRLSLEEEPLTDKELNLKPNPKVFLLIMQ